MKFLNTSLLGIFLLSVSLSAIAQEADSAQDPNIWTLKQCVDYALRNNLTIKRSVLDVEGAEIDYDLSRWALLPSLNASVSYGYNWGRSLNPVTYEFTTQELNSINPGAQSSVTLFNGLQLQNRIRQTETGYEASNEELLKTKNDVILNIASLYINVIFNKEQFNNARFQLASSQSQLERVRKQVMAGALAKSEQLNLEAQVATNEVNLITQENTLIFSLLQLKQALQLPASTPLDVELMEVEVEDLVLDQSRDEIYSIARQTMPEIRAANLRVSSSAYAVKAARGNLYPRLSLGGSINSNYSSASDRPRFIPDGGDEIVVGYDEIGFVQGSDTPVLTEKRQPSGIWDEGYGKTDQLRDNIYRSVGLTLTIPLFNNMQSRAGLHRAIINKGFSEIAAKETENTLRQNVETAYNNAIAASKTYQSSLRQVQAREEAFRMMEQRFGAGAANSFEYQVSQNDLFRARTDLIRAKYDFIFRKKVLDFYQGKPLEY